MAPASEGRDKMMNETQSQMLRPLRMGDTAPDFSARTTMGHKSLSDFRGRWLIFFSHPADFTPVCTTEFVALASASSDFDQANCALLGLSVDSLYAHLAWVKAIEEQFATTIGFPIVEDPSMAVARAYGMIDEAAVDSTGVRATYFIDPEGVVRAIITYPHNVGRSVAEMLRLLQALQAVSDGQNVAPENWHPGQALLSPPALTADAMAGRSNWFCHAAGQ
jgi:peroxiredoxin (alkyl hydroperoxide reductase subunit C)